MYKLKPHQTIRSTSGNRKKKPTSKAIIAQAYQSRCCFWRSSSVPESLENFHLSYASSKGKWASSFLKTMPSEIYAASGGLHFRGMSWRVKRSLCRQPFNFLSCMRKIRHAIRKQLVRQICVSFAGIKLAKTTCELLSSSFCLFSFSASYALVLSILTAKFPWIVLFRKVFLCYQL